MGLVLNARDSWVGQSARTYLFSLLLSPNPRLNSTPMTSTSAKTYFERATTFRVAIAPSLRVLFLCLRRAFLSVRSAWATLSHLARHCFQSSFPLSRGDKQWPVLARARALGPPFSHYFYLYTNGFLRVRRLGRDDGLRSDGFRRGRSRSCAKRAIAFKSRIGHVVIQTRREPIRHALLPLPNCLFSTSRLASNFFHGFADSDGGVDGTSFFSTTGALFASDSSSSTCSGLFSSTRDFRSPPFDGLGAGGTLRGD